MSQQCKGIRSLLGKDSCIFAASLIFGALEKLGLGLFGKSNPI
jgi:hypothetical protein